MLENPQRSRADLHDSAFPFLAGRLVTDLLSAGPVTLTADEAKQELGVRRGVFLDPAACLQCEGDLLTPRRGSYAIVPLQHLSWGAPPASW